MNNTKRLLVSTLLASLFSTAALAATPGFDPETGRIILPSEVALEEEDYESTKQDMAAIQAAEAQYKALQEAAEETSRIQLWEKLDSEIKLRRYDKLVFDSSKNGKEIL